MTPEQLDAIRERAQHPLHKWNSVTAQSDRERLLVEVTRLRARLAELEAQLNKGELCPR